MSSRQFLSVVALVQGALLLALVILIILNRWFRVRLRARVDPKRQALDQAMQRWALGGGSVAGVTVGLSQLPVPVAVDALVAWAARVPGERWATLADALTRSAWTRLVRSNSRSARWWKRLECARLLSVVAVPGDTARLVRLLMDVHPAVHIAAVAALERMESVPLITLVLQRIPELPPTVHAYYAGMLRRSRPIVVRLLIEHLRRAADPALPRLAEFAVRLADPALRAPLTALAAHRDPEVRVQAARALGHYPHAESLAALRTLTGDPAWAVRAQAVRALGMIGATEPGTVPLIEPLLKDAEWWVRLRAGLALTRCGATGRNLLLAAETGAHPEARAVAGLVLGLSSQAVAEFAA